MHAHVFEAPAEGSTIWKCAVPYCNIALTPDKMPEGKSALTRGASLTGFARAIGPDMPGYILPTDEAHLAAMRRSRAEAEQAAWDKRRRQREASERQQSYYFQATQDMGFGNYDASIFEFLREAGGIPKVGDRVRFKPPPRWDEQ